MDLEKRRLLHIAAALSLAQTGKFAQAQRGYPERSVTLFHTSPGGSLDASARLVSDKLRSVWSQPVLVDAKPGAAGAVAAAYIAKAPPDGYQFVIGGSAMVNNLLGSAPMGYTLEDITPVCLFAHIPAGLAVRSSLGVKSLSEFIALAKASPGKLTFGSIGQGSASHLLGELLNQAAGIQIVHVPYKGEAPAMQDLLGGNIDAIFTGLGPITRYPSKIVPIAVASPSRFPTHPELPTFSDLGFPQVNLPGWALVIAPPRTPKAIIDKAAADIAQALASPDVTSKMVEMGLLPSGMGPDKTAALIQQHLGILRPLIAQGVFTVS